MSLKRFIEGLLGVPAASTAGDVTAVSGMSAAEIERAIRHQGHAWLVQSVAGAE